MDQNIYKKYFNVFFLNSENKKKQFSAGPKKWNVKNDKANP